MSAVAKQTRTTLGKKQESVRPYDTLRRTTCCGCPAGCGIKVFLKGDEIVDVFGDEDHPANKGSFCPKGLLGLYHLKNPHRLTEPGVRESPDAPFKTVAWPEAIEFTAQALLRLAGKHGKESIFVFGSETAPTDHLLAGAWFCENLAIPNNPYTSFPSPFGASGKISEMFGVAASQLLTNSPRDWCNSRCIVVLGSDPAASDPITFGPVIDARDRGAALIVIDSRETMTASKADLFLQVKPGSHATALKGLIHLLYGQDGIDRDSLDDMDFGRLEREVALFPPDRVAADCWLEAQQLLEAAGLIGRSKPLQVLAADWGTRQFLSDEELCLAGALVCLRGSLGIPGGGLNLLSASPFSAPQNTAPGRSLEEILLDPATAVGAAICHGNPYADLAGGRQTRQAFEKIPFVVHLSSYADDTRKRAQVSLPMSSWFEHSALVATGNGRALQWCNAVAQAPEQCRSGLEFWTDLAGACGLAAALPWLGDDGGVDARAAADFFLKRNPLTRAASVAALDPEKNSPGGLLWPSVDEGDLDFEEDRFGRGDVRGRNILFRRRRAYPLSDRRFPTPTGKVGYPAIAGRDADDEDDHMPLMLTTGVLVDAIRDFGFFVSDVDRATAPPPVRLHPRIAKLLGIGSGEPVVVENERGRISGTSCPDSRLDPRVVWCPHGLDAFHPRSLFARAADPFARVLVRRPEQDGEEARHRLIEFLEAGGMRP